MIISAAIDSVSVSGANFTHICSDCVRTGRDRKVIPSANPTKSKTANPSVVVSLTLD